MVNVQKVRSMRIAVASLEDPRALGTWSGIPANIMMALSRGGHEVLAVSLKRPSEPWHYKWLRRYYHRVHRRWFLSSVEEQWLKSISRQLDSQVNSLRPEVVLVIHADWLSYATFQYPACIIHDTTFASIANYYPSFTNLSDRSLRMGHRMYDLALKKASAAIFPANWASHSAISRYGYPPSKVFTIPFGANIYPLPQEGDVKDWIVSRAAGGTCNFLFMGTQWNRKGGPDILRFLEALHRRGVPATLTIVGCSPEIPHSMVPFVRIAGYLRKDDPVDAERLVAIFKDAHALILLSHAECYGCVYCEANAFGLPALGRDTGGVSEIIRDGINGLLLRVDESVEELATRWITVWSDREAYKEISIASYTEFKERLNYDIFAQKLERVLVSILQCEN